MKRLLLGALCSLVMPACMLTEEGGECFSDLNCESYLVCSDYGYCEDPYGDGSSSSGSGDECATFNDTTAYFGDTQLDTTCLSAGLYDTCDQYDEWEYACATVENLLDCCWDGGGSCPYC